LQPAGVGADDRDRQRRRAADPRDRLVVGRQRVAARLDPRAQLRRAVDRQPHDLAQRFTGAHVHGSIEQRRGAADDRDPHVLRRTEVRGLEIRRVVAAGLERRAHVERSDAGVVGRLEHGVHEHAGVEHPRRRAVGHEVHFGAGHARPAAGVAAARREAIDRCLDERGVGRWTFDEAVGGGGDRDVASRG
jgi:hypothetical protein